MLALSYHGNGNGQARRARPCAAAYPKLYDELGADTIRLTTPGMEAGPCTELKRGPGLVPPCTRGIVSLSRGAGRKPGASLYTWNRLSLTGGREKAWCLIIHAEVSLSLLICVHRGPTLVPVSGQLYTLLATYHLLGCYIDGGKGGNACVSLKPLAVIPT